MKKIVITLLLFFIFRPAVFPADDNTMGKIVFREGRTVKTNLNCSEKGCADDLIIRRGDRIRTGGDSMVKVLLNDGTGIVIYERSDIIFNNVMSGNKKKPTDIYIESGKFKFFQENSSLDPTLVIKTANSIVKTVCATFCLIVSTKESGIFVATGEAGFASAESSITGAYIVKEGEESFIRAGNPPIKPVKVDFEMQGSWLSRMVVSKDRATIKRIDQEGSLIDWPFMKKD